MIVVIRDEVFTPDNADDTLLGWILRQGMHGRFGVRTRPAFKISESREVNRWLKRQSENACETALSGLKRGLKWPERAWPEGRLEPKVVIDIRERSQWPRSFDDDAAYLPLGDELESFLSRPLRIKLENEIGDWAFLERVVPSTWQGRWQLATKRRWIDSEQGGGLTEITRVLEEEIADDHERQLRMWVMFDSDCRLSGEVSPAAKKLSETCERVGVPYHMLARRMIENYVPDSAMRAWAQAVQAKVASESDKSRDREAAARLVREVEAYWASPPNERHCHDLKKIAAIAKKKKFDMGTVADIWRRSEYEITDTALDGDGWKAERYALFDSLFASL